MNDLGIAVVCADNLQCIEAKFVCEFSSHDGSLRPRKHDCYDKSDEHNKLCGCPTRSDNQRADWFCMDGDGCEFIGEVCDGRADCNDESDENEIMCHSWQCPSNRIKCANDMQCINISHVCDGNENCRDKSDELCYDPCLKRHLKNKSIIRKCPEDRTKCIPVEDYCDRVLDCPDGSDEAGCSCEDWNMYNCSIGESNLCIITIRYP